MSIPLAQLQCVMQQSILEGNEAILTFVKRPPRDTPQVMLGVYRNAYVLRLIEVLANDWEKLKTYLGDDAFAAMARAYVKAHPSHSPNARWFGRHLPAFLAGTEPWSKHPEVSELAALEGALADAFDAPDAPVFGLDRLRTLDPARFGDATIAVHPSAAILEATTNAASIWSALKAEERPPKAEMLRESSRVLVWRQASASRFRILGAEEAMALGEAANGVPFGVLCEMIATMDDPDSAAARAASYLRGWIEAEVVSDVTC